MTKERGKDGMMTFASSTVLSWLNPPRESACQGRVTCYNLSHVNGLLPLDEENLTPLFLALLTLDLVIV